MELSPANTEPKKSDVTIARDFISEIAQHCWHGKKDMIDRVYDAIMEKFPKSSWTRRRVRAIWHREAAGIHFHEMCELIDVAEAAAKAAEDHKFIQEARRGHREYLAKTARVAALLERQDPDFPSPAFARLGGVMG